MGSVAVIAVGGSLGVMVALATLDPARPEIRAEAQLIADRLAADPGGDSDVTRTLRSMLDDLAHGERILVIRENQEVTPAQAAQMIGVTRQFVDRLLADGVLAFHRLPGSTHRRLKASDVITLMQEREKEKTGHAVLRDAFADMGLLDPA